MSINIKGTNIDFNISEAFSKMSFLAAIFVVMLHTFSSIESNVYDWLLSNIFVSGICRCAIPWFFFAAGFWFFGHVGEKGWWKEEVIKRVKTLCVPFWVWSIIIGSYWLVFAILIRYFNYSYGGIDAFKWFSGLGYVTLLGLNPFEAVPTMWFLRALFIIVLISPLLIRLGFVSFSILFVLYGCSEFFSCYENIDRRIIYTFASLFSLRGIVYFLLGMLVRKKIDILTYVKKHSIICLVLGVSIMTFKLILMRLNFTSFAMLSDVIMVPFLMFGILSFISCFSFSQKYIALSFPLYLIHNMFAYFLTAVYGVIGFSSSGTPFYLGLIRFVLSMVVSLVIATFLIKHFPSFSRVVFGGRVGQ